MATSSCLVTQVEHGNTNCSQLITYQAPRIKGKRTDLLDRFIVIAAEELISSNNPSYSLFADPATVHAVFPSEL
jgi:hypothetical protein